MRGLCIKTGCRNEVMEGTIHALCEEHYDEWCAPYFRKADCWRCEARPVCPECESCEKCCTCLP